MSYLRWMYHESVLLQKVINKLDIKKNGIYIDATLGGGGVSFEILRRLSGGVLICFDIDEDAIKNFKSLFYLEYKTKFKGMEDSINGNKIFLFRENFSNIKNSLDTINISKIDGIVYDFGVSSFQIDDASKGFSYMQNSILDMRMNKDLKITAQDLVNGMYESELEGIFRIYSEEPFSKQIARNIVKSRKMERIETSDQLVAIIKKSIRNQAYLYHHVSRIFQALRIKINNELGVIFDSLLLLPDILKHGGRVVLITFHSGEDRIVKNYFSESEEFFNLEKKIILPTDEEIFMNKRARSAKMRVYERK